jgi:hypothetical protein
MTDFGTKPTRSVSSAIVRGSPLQFTYDPLPDYHLGTFAMRTIGGGSGNAPIYIDRTLYTDAPPPSNGSGDHGIAAFKGVLPVENTEQTEPYAEVLYVVPAGCRLFIIEYELFNDTPAAATPKLYFGQYPIHTTEIPSRGAVLQPTRKILHAGQEIQGSGPSPGDIEEDTDPGVWCWVTAILEVP